MVADSHLPSSPAHGEVSLLMLWEPGFLLDQQEPSSGPGDDLDIVLLDLFIGFRDVCYSLVHTPLRILVSFCVFMIFISPSA